MILISLVLILGVLWLIVLRLGSSTYTSDWLIVQQSGGKVVRHWILSNKEVKIQSLTNRCSFDDITGNRCIVFGDFFMTEINQTIETFKSSYKKKYNVPENQEALK